MTPLAPAPILDPEIGAKLLTDLGFLHVPGRPLSAPPAYLVVGLRHTPTLRHFDPERVDYWICAAGRGVRASLDRSALVRPQSEYSWGTLDVVDRKAVGNEFVSFGGQLSVTRVGDVRVAVFCSDAPIAARGGHSQGWDPLAEEMAAFVGRLRAAAGTDLEFEHRLSELSPLGAYAAFVADGLVRHRDGRGRLVGDPRAIDLLHRERNALLVDCPADWAAGGAVACELP